MGRGRFALLFFVAATSFSSTLRAEDNVARAERLFGEGRALLQASKWAEACAKFSESQTASPSVGTLMNLGLCNEKQGRFGSAVRAYQEAITSAGSADAARVTTARERVRVLEPKAPKLLVHVDASIPDLKVMSDAAPVPLESPPKPFLVDPGNVLVSASAPGRKPFHTTVAATEGATVEVSIPALEIVQSAPVPRESPPSEARPPSTTGERNLTIPLVAGGVAIAGFAGFAYFWFTGQSDIDDLRDRCAPRCTDDDVDPVRTKNVLAIVSLSVGIVATAVGVGSLLLNSPRTVQAGPRGFVVRF